MSIRILKGTRERGGWQYLARDRGEFITLLGGAAAAWPLGARAQQPERMRRIGALMALAESDPQLNLADSVRGGIAKARMEPGPQSWAGGDEQRLRTYAAELVGAAPDVLFAADDLSQAPAARPQTRL
jgi:putative ABC transport system substrate-binding protein